MDMQNEQRQRRKDETAAGTPWQLRYFVHVESDPDCESHGFVCSSSEVYGLTYQRVDEALVGPISDNSVVVPAEDGYVFKAPG